MTLGASSAKRSRTTNSSDPRAVDSLADAAQSIESMSSPGRYGREPATSVPAPRRRLFIVPNERPMTRRRGTSGKVRRAPGTARYSGLEVRPRPHGSDPVFEERILFGARLRGELEAARAKLLASLGPAPSTSARHAPRSEDDAMDEHRSEQSLDVLGDHVAPAVEERPRTGGALEREASAHRAPDDDRLLLTRRPHELDDPAMERVVDVYILCRGAQLVHLVEADDRLECVQRVHVALVGEDAELVVDARVPERRSQEEAVELRFRQRECPLVLDRVLGREEKERVRQLPGHAVDRHLPLGHSLEEG